jgi:hypothetical protein
MSSQSTYCFYQVNTCTAEMLRFSKASVELNERTGGYRCALNLHRQCRNNWKNGSWAAALQKGTEQGRGR